jgi:cytochrome bd-type quinol oxidase subunit 1
MNMTQKFATSFVAIAAVSVVLFTSANADSMKQAQPVQVAAATQSVAVAPLNSPETPASQLNDLQYN